MRHIPQTVSEIKPQTAVFRRDLRANDHGKSRFIAPFADADTFERTVWRQLPRQCHRAALPSRDWYPGHRCQANKIGSHIVNVYRRNLEAIITASGGSK